MKTALITGGSKGIGLEMVNRWVNKGYKVVTCSRSSSSWDSAVSKHPELKDVDYQSLDITDEIGLAHWYQYIAQTYGQIDIAVNNASPAIASLGEFSSVEIEDLKSTLDNDFWAQALNIRYQIKMMSAGSTMVNVSSINGLRPTPNATMYCAAKHAIEGLTQSLALENIEKGIRINAVAPGVTWTPRWEERAEKDEQLRDNVSSQVPIQRFARISEIADAIDFLLSDKSSYIVGHTLVVDGGISLK